jgi:hypothetical protein
VDDLRNVAATLEHGDAQVAIFDRHRATASIRVHLNSVDVHRVHSRRPRAPRAVSSSSSTAPAFLALRPLCD